MKLFTCDSVNSGCTWSMTARTEELLMDQVALHLRAAHDMPAVSPELAGRIKNLFRSPWLDDAAGSVDIIMQEYNCDREPRCTWQFIAQAESMLTGNRPVHERELIGS
jgi:predicted small metal-binding protein